MGIFKKIVFYTLVASAAVTTAHPQMRHQQRYEQTQIDYFGYVPLTNESGKTITCKLLDYDSQTRRLQIEIQGSESPIWFSPDLLDQASKDIISEWVQKKYARDQFQLTIRQMSGEKPDTYYYKLEVNNRSTTPLEQITLAYTIYLETTTFSNDDRSWIMQKGKHHSIAPYQDHFIPRRLKVGTLKENESKEFSTEMRYVQNESKSVQERYSENDSSSPHTARVRTKTITRRINQEFYGIVVEIYEGQQHIRTEYSDVKLKEFIAEEARKKAEKQKATAPLQPKSAPIREVY